jgi:hypothetical protein
MINITVSLRSAFAFSVLLASCSRAPHSSAVAAKYDAATGKLSQLTVNSTSDDKPNVFSYMDGSKFVRIEIDRDEDGKIDRWEYYSTDQKLEKVGISRSNDGIVDAWLFQGTDGTVNRIEVSTHRDGQVNRLEFYESGERVRAEEDTNKDGRADKWETYVNGGLATVSFDTTGLGTPNHVIDYRSNP